LLKAAPAASPTPRVGALGRPAVRGVRLLVSRAGAAPVIGVLLGVLVGALVFAGCQSNPEPPPLETESPSPSASPSASPTEAAPTLPPEAEGTDEAAAKAFVRHYVDVLNYSGPAAETEALRALSTRSCSACIGIADFIDGVAADGGQIEGDGWTIRQLTLVTSDPSNTEIVIDALVEVHPQQVRPSSGADLKEFDGGQRLKTFWLKHRSPGWQVSRIDQPS